MNARFPFAFHHCRDYIIPERDNFDIDAVCDADEIAREMAACETQHSEAYCESLCLYRAIAEQLPRLERFVFHGAAVSIDGKGFIFTAPSGTGKTTHIDLLMSNYPENVSIINGDKPIIHVADNAARVCSTPWAGKEGLNANVSCDLAGIVLLRRGEVNRIRQIQPNDYFADIVAQTYFPKDSMARLQTFELLDKLARTVPFYVLECNISADAAKTSFEELKTKA